MPPPVDAPPWDDRHLALIGLSGAGKTTVGQILAERLGRPFVDLDHEIERACDQTVAEIFADHEELGFRAREADILDQVLAREPLAVIATGGGAIEWLQNRTGLRKSAWVVWLKVSPDTAHERIPDDEGRPLLADGDRRSKLEHLYRERKTNYRLTAHSVVDANGSPIEVADRVLVPPVPRRKRVALVTALIGGVVLLAGLTLARPGSTRVAIERVFWDEATIAGDGSILEIGIDQSFDGCDTPNSVRVAPGAPLGVEVRYAFDPGQGTFCSDTRRPGDQLVVTLRQRVGKSVSIVDRPVVDGELYRCDEPSSGIVQCR